jgi:hypothetical protein
MSGRLSPDLRDFIEETRNRDLWPVAATRFLILEAPVDRVDEVIDLTTYDPKPGADDFMIGREMITAGWDEKGAFFEAWVTRSDRDPAGPDDLSGTIVAMWKRADDKLVAFQFEHCTVRDFDVGFFMSNNFSRVKIGFKADKLLA